MFRTISIVLVVLTLAGCAMWWKLAKLPARRPAGSTGRFPGLEKLLAVVMWLSFATLAVTGTFGAIIPGHSLAGFWMLTHVSVSALFAGSLAVLIIVRAESYNPANTVQPGRFGLGQKISFWIMAVCGIVLIVTVVASMFRVLGTEWQLLAIKTHRYFALLALLAGIVYACQFLKRKS